MALEKTVKFLLLFVGACEGMTYVVVVVLGDSEKD